ncbi:MAG: ribosomal RNA small subunit methyltransferase A [candidate division Zixibacteria bacterium]|nr:ribosomal RNA small subunit methyltransferase A [candidate division Zixibacteria bacterium]
MSRIKAKKNLGQHFLTDIIIAHKIVNSIDPKPEDNIVEIGSGKGALTEILLTHECQVTAIEFDRDLLPALEIKFGDLNNFTLIARNFLDIEPGDMPAKMKLIGNIPYNITTAILEKLFEFKKSVSCAVFMVQSEVADRLTASPGTRANGSFTMIMAAGFDIKILFTVKPESFKPIPRVVSKVIKLIPVSREPDNFDNFKTFVRGCFSHKRKTLANSMQMGLKLPKEYCEALITRISKHVSVRPEQLSFDNYLKLYEMRCKLEQ